MKNIPVPSKASPFIQALRELIRTGASAAPNLETSCLIDLPVVLAQCPPNATASKRAQVFLEVLQHIASHRLQGKDRKTAQILFGIGKYAGVPIQDRYRAVAKLYNKYWTWENYRKEPLTRHLFAVYLALERETEGHTTASPYEVNAQKIHTGYVGQDWVMERIKSVYVFPKAANDPLQVIQTRHLRAISDNIATWRHYAQWRERGVSGMPNISLIGPGKVAILDNYLEPATHIQTYITEVSLPKPIKYGDTTEFTLVKQVYGLFGETNDLGWDWYGVTLASPTKEVAIELRFAPPHIPKAIWRYEDRVIGILTRPGTPTAGNRLAIDDTGYVNCRWSNVSAGYSYGIALEW